MIKGNESDVWNIDLRYSSFYIVFELFISLQPDVRLRWGLDLNVQVIYVGKLKLNIADMCFIPLDGATYSAGYSWGFGTPLLLATPLE